VNSRFSNAIDYVQYLGILLATILVPLVFYIGNQNIVILKPLTAQFIAFALFGLWLLDALERNEFELPETPLNKPIVLYMLWLVVTILFSSVFWYYSLEEMGRYLAMFLLFFLVQKTVRSRSRLRWALWVLFFVCFVATGWGFIQQLHQMDIVQRTIVNWGRDVMVSTFGNKNFFAGFLVLTAPVIFGYIWATRKWVIRGVLMVLFLAEFYILMATGTRTGFLGFWIGMGVFIFLVGRFIWLGNRMDKSERNRRLIVIGVAFVLLIILAYLFIPQHLIDRLMGAFDLQRGTQRVRWIMWTGATRAATAAPVMGHGHGVFQLVFPNYRPTFYHRFRVSHNTRHSHNEFLEVLLETGLVGLSLFLLLFVVLGVVTYRFLKRSRSRFYNFLVIGLISGVAASLTQNFASVNFRWMSSTYTMWFLISLNFAVIRVASGMGESEDSGNNRGRIQGNYRWLPKVSWRTPIHFIIILGIGGIGYSFYRLVQADFHLKELNGLINLAESQRRNVSWDQAIQAGHESIRYSPFSLSTRYKLGFAYLQKGDYRRAFEQYDILTDMAPNYAQIHNNIALIHRRFEHPYRSLLHFEWATGLEDNHRNHLNLTRRYSQQGLSHRAAHHALYIPNLTREDHRDVFHVLSTKDRQSLPGKYSRGTSREYNRKDRQRQRMNSFLSRYYSEKDRLMSQFFKFRQFVSSATQRRTLARVVQGGRQGQSIEPSILLAMTRKLRGRQGQQFRRFYLQSLRSLVEDGQQGDPVVRLALAEILAQQGNNERANQIVTSLPDNLSDHPFYWKSIQFVKES
jgi:O-antigen ligase/tetratricopeptide (TPR) repeat protein